MNTTTQAPDRATLRTLMDEYLETLDDKNCDGGDFSTRSLEALGLNGFFAWLYKDEAEKAARREQYEELKAEFEGAPS